VGGRRGRNEEEISEDGMIMNGMIFKTLDVLTIDWIN
jgi:hypothetical protein